MLGRTLDLTRPVTDHPLNRGITSGGWWSVLPGGPKGNRVRNLAVPRNHGTGVSMLGTALPTVRGPFGRSDPFGSLSFDATNQHYYDCGVVPGLDGASRFTLSAWFWLPAAATLAGTGRVSPSSRRVSLSYFNDGNLYVIVDGGYIFGMWSSGTRATAGAWHRSCMVYDGAQAAADRIKWYCNGRPVAMAFGATAPTTVPAGGTDPFSIGMFDASSYPTGLIADQRLLVGRAYAAADAWAEYQSARRGHPELLAWRSSKVYFFIPADGGGALTLALTGVAAPATVGAVGIVPGPVAFAPSGLLAPATLGTASVEAVVGTAVAPSGFTDAPAFGTSTLSPGPVAVAPTGLADAPTFGAVVVDLAGQQTLAPAAVLVDPVYGATLLVPGPVALAPSGLTDAPTFGTATLGAFTAIVPATWTAAATPGTARVTVGPVAIAPPGVTDDFVSGTTTLSIAAGPSVTLQPASHIDPPTTDTAYVLVGALALVPTGIADPATVGTQVLQPGPVALAPASVTDPAAFGGVTVTVGAVTLAPAGLADAASLGAQTLVPGPVALAPGSVVDPVTLGEPAALAAGSALIRPVPSAASPAFGTTTLAAGSVSIAALGVSTSAMLGTPAVLWTQILAPTGLEPGSRVGAVYVLGAGGNGGIFVDGEELFPSLF